MALYDELTTPVTKHDAAFPLGVWAASGAEGIVDRIAVIRRTADQRLTSIDDVLARVRSVLDFNPARSVSEIDTDFEVPAKIGVDPGVRRFGFGDHMWTECCSPSFSADHQYPSRI
ncbi:hypothetical protein [Nocardia carnea]|uniref:Transposase n=1 Tax=Nocardia carnea TaxID=37328 RepID=A0ABW7U177_9NOCA|nr:hypothetical protein [Nocardia carnea]